MRHPLGFKFIPEYVISQNVFNTRERTQFTSPALPELGEVQARTTEGKLVKIRVPKTETTKLEQTIFKKVFDALKQDNWKMPTHFALVNTKTEANLIARGITYYSGGAEIRHLEDGSFLVGSKGYYHYVGA
jgi:hypothetical protein